MRNENFSTFETRVLQTHRESLQQNKKALLCKTTHDEACKIKLSKSWAEYKTFRGQSRVWPVQPLSSRSRECSRIITRESRDYDLYRTVLNTGWYPEDYNYCLLRVAVYTKIQFIIPALRLFSMHLNKILQKIKNYLKSQMNFILDPERYF